MIALDARPNPTRALVTGQRVGSLHLGPAHVFEHVNDAFLFRNAGRDVLGLPAREAFPEPRFAPMQALMDHVYLTGRRRRMATHDGTLAVLPRVAGGRVIGVTCLFEPLPPLPRARGLRRPQNRVD